MVAVAVVVAEAVAGVTDSRKIVLQWHITDRCNHQCRHCYQQPDIYHKEMDWENLVGILEQFKELLQYINKQHNNSPIKGQINVTGGEPFMRLDFMDLLELLSVNKELFSFAILTNGSFINRDIAQKLKKTNPQFVQLSVEGNETTHDSIRGAGDFIKTVRAIRELVQAKVRTYISFTAHRANYRDFVKVADLGKSLKVAKVWADRLIPAGRGQDLANLVLTPQETQEFFEIMAAARDRLARSWFHTTEIDMQRGLQFLVGGGLPYRCTAGDSLLAVMPNGDVYPCRRLPIRVGNVQQSSLLEIYTTSEDLRKIREVNGSPSCKQCWYERMCRGGLRCLSYALYGSLEKADPGCWYV